jgi:hypothetical protein
MSAESHGGSRVERIVAARLCFLGFIAVQFGLRFLGGANYAKWPGRRGFGLWKAFKTMSPWCDVSIGERSDNVADLQSREPNDHIRPRVEAMPNQIQVV